MNIFSKTLLFFLYFLAYSKIFVVKALNTIINILGYPCILLIKLGIYVAEKLDKPIFQKVFRVFSVILYFSIAYFIVDYFDSYYLPTTNSYFCKTIIGGLFRLITYGLVIIIHERYNVFRVKNL